MRKIRVQVPAKINLTLEVLGRRDDGFHNIQSIMQAISLYDYLDICVHKKEDSLNEIKLSGTSDEIPYDEKNIVYKAVELYLKESEIVGVQVYIHIEKNIPVSAGLAGGSSNASGALWGLNKILGKFSYEKLHNLASKLGSDLNFCMDGGCAYCTGRGEIIEKVPFAKFDVALIKPKSLGISAKEAYYKFSQLKDKSNPDNTPKLKTLLEDNKFDKNLIYNSFEKALFPEYECLQKIKSKIPGSLMSGSGSTFFVIGQDINSNWDDDFLVFNGLHSISFGVKEV